MRLEGTQHTTTVIRAEPVRSVLAVKGTAVWSIGPDATVYEAIKIMDERGVGALVVVSEGDLAGIVSERDYARKVILKGRSSKDTLVREIMTSEVYTAAPEDLIDDCLRVMTEKHIRHLPVLEGRSLAGIVSIGDLVSAIISAQADAIQHLHNYIAGAYPA